MVPGGGVRTSSSAPPALLPGRPGPLPVPAARWAAFLQQTSGVRGAQSHRSAWRPGSEDRALEAGPGRDPEHGERPPGSRHPPPGPRHAARSHSGGETAAKHPNKRGALPPRPGDRSVGAQGPGSTPRSCGRSAPALLLACAPTRTHTRAHSHTRTHKHAHTAPEWPRDFHLLPRSAQPCTAGSCASAGDARGPPIHSASLISSSNIVTFSFATRQM